MLRTVRFLGGILLGLAAMAAPVTARADGSLADGCPDGVQCSVLSCTGNFCCLINVTEQCICDCERVE